MGDFEQLSQYFTGVHLVQIGILWFLVYWTLRYLETTIAGNFLRSIGFFAILGKAFSNNLAGKIDISTVFEVDIHDGKAKVRH